IVWQESDLTAALGGDAALAEEALAVLEQAQLIRVRDKTIGIAHEALLTSWRHLSALRLSHMDRLAFLERVREAALAWERADRHKELLERGTLLAELREHQAWLTRGLTLTERDFVRESLRRATARKVWRASTVILGLLIVGLGLFGLHTLEGARRAEENA